MRSGVRVTGVVLLAVLAVGVLVRIVTALRFGRAGSDTIPLAHRSNPGNQESGTSPTGLSQRLRPTTRSSRAGGQHQAAYVATAVHEEETEVAIKEPGITASPNRALAMTAGALFAIWGILGFFFAGDDGHAFFGDTGGLLWNAFLVNPALAAVWTLLAAALIIVGLGNTVGSRNVNLLVGLVLIVLAVYGFVFTNTSANVFALNTTDNVFHAIVGVVLLLTALGADKQNIRALRAAARA